MKEAIELVRESSPAVFYVLAALFGICVGSFLNVCIYRIPKKESIVVVPSHCMSCGKKLHWYELIPIFSYIFLRGKCSGCKAKISPQYCIVEATTGALWALVYFVKGAAVDTILIQLLVSALLVIAVIDARTKEIPFPVVIFIAVLGAIRIIFYHESWRDIVLGPVVMAALFLAIIFISDGRAMGGGDYKLCTAMGLFLGLKLTFLGLVIGCILGSIIHVARMIIQKVGRELAFGPYLAAGFAISALWGAQMWSWYVTKFFSF